MGKVFTVSKAEECVRAVVMETKSVDLGKFKPTQGLQAYKKMIVEGTMRLEQWKMMHSDFDRKLIINEVFLGSQGGYEEYQKYLLDLEREEENNIVDSMTGKAMVKSTSQPTLMVNGPEERIGTKSMIMTKALAMNHLMSDGIIKGFTAQSLQLFLVENYGIAIENESEAEDMAKQVNKMIVRKESDENPIAKSCRETLQKMSIENKWGYEECDMIAQDVIRSSTKAGKDLGRIITELKVKPDDVKVKKRALRWLEGIVPDLFEILSKPNQEIVRLGK